MAFSLLIIKIEIMLNDNHYSQPYKLGMAKSRRFGLPLQHLRSIRTDASKRNHAGAGGPELPYFYEFSDLFLPPARG